MKSTLAKRIRRFEWILTGLIILLAAYPTLRAHFLVGVPEPQSRVGALQSMQLNIQSLALSGAAYLEDHDARRLEKINTAGKDISRFLSAYKSQAGGAAARDPQQMEAHYEALRLATVGLLKADAALLTQTAALQRTSRSLLQLFDDQILPTVEGRQKSNTRRLEAALAARAEARGVLSQTADNFRFRSAITTFKAASGFRGLSAAINAEQLFALGQSQNRDLSVAGQERRQAVDRFFATSRDLSEALALVMEKAGATHEARNPGEGAGGRGVLVVLAVVLCGLLFFDRLLIASTVRPLQAMTQVVEAATSGDLLRPSATRDSNEIERLSTAVQRLITALDRSENLVYHLAALVESSGGAIVGQTLEGSILSWNKAAQRLYGYSAEEVKGRPITLLAPPESAFILKDAMGRVKSGERITPFEMQHRAKDGRAVHVVVRIAPILDSTRHVIGASFCAEGLPTSETRRRENSAPHSASIL